MIIDLLRRISKGLDEKRINYMLTGSIALNNYSLPRMTLDIDIVIELDKDNLKNFLSIFGEKYYFDKETVSSETKKRGMFNIIDYETGFKIDFIVRKDNEYKKLEFSRRIKTRIADSEIWMVSPEDLIIAKIEWIQQLQSDKQIQDIKNLMLIDSLDKDYIRKWCEILHLKTFNLI